MNWKELKPKVDSMAFIIKQIEILLAEEDTADLHRQIRAYEKQLELIIININK